MGDLDSKKLTTLAENGTYENNG